MLIILQELMHRMYVECEGEAPRRDQIPKPCDYFDLIAGTGTGGLIAVMLGRLRLDIETCKKIYPRMTKYVFETDKTLAGLPLRSTLFKASRLEEAIRQCVREHTRSEEEGNDGTPSPTGSTHTRYSSLTSASTVSIGTEGPRRRSSLHRTWTPTPPAAGYLSPVGGNTWRWGNPDALLYDKRQNRTKTAITAYLKGTPRHGLPMLLRSYDSRKEPPPDFDCTIWQAGRATSAMSLHFKPAQIGQQLFIDEGGGKFNSAPLILDEATVNEWPGREVGVFISVGTGKRPSGPNSAKHEWWEDVFSDFADARKKLIAKIEGCETIHQYMLKEHLAKRNVPKENYYRLNVDTGVGGFGMNEWNRLTEISTNTRIYLSKSEVEKMNYEAAAKLAKIHRMHRRLENHANAIAAEEDQVHNSPTPPLHRPIPPAQRPVPPVPGPPPQQLPASPPESPRQSNSQPLYELPAIELPADHEIPPIRHNRPPTYSNALDAADMSPHGSRPSLDHQSISPAYQGSPRASSEIFHFDRPPVPPKTPIPYPDNAPGSNGGVNNLTMPTPAQPTSHPVAANKWKLPYPDDGPPPPVNKSRKPTYSAR